MKIFTTSHSFAPGWRLLLARLPRGERRPPRLLDLLRGLLRARLRAQLLPRRHRRLPSPGELRGCEEDQEEPEASPRLGFQGVAACRRQTRPTSVMITLVQLLLMPFDTIFRLSCPDFPHYRCKQLLSTVIPQ